MNIIRTGAVELTTIPAIAYKQKLTAGGSGIKIIRLDQEAEAVATIDKRTAGAVPYRKYDEALFPMEAFDEAIEATIGLPYSARGALKVTVSAKVNEEDVTEEADEGIDMVDSPEYQAIIDQYMDEKGKMNYALMNRDFIKFTAKSKIVADMLGEGKSTDEIVKFVVGSRAQTMSNSKNILDDQHTTDLIETLDEIDPRSAFKELKNYINRLQSRNKGR